MGPAASPGQCILMRRQKAMQRNGNFSFKVISLLSEIDRSAVEVLRQDCRLDSGRHNRSL